MSQGYTHQLTIPVPVTQGGTGTLGTGILDTSGNTQIGFSKAASAVNYLLFSNNATGLPPVINAVGTDTNIDLNIGGKGTGALNVLGGTAASNAPSGYVGEFISSSIVNASAVNLPNGTATNITSISLTAGDWDVWGNVKGEFTVSSIYLYAWISTTSATLPDLSLISGSYLAAATIAIHSVAIAAIRVNVSSPTTVYLSAQSGFGAGTSSGCGNIYARRRR